MNCHFSNHLTSSLDAVLQRSKQPPPVVMVAPVDSPLKRSRTESPPGASSPTLSSENVSQHDSSTSSSPCKYLRSILCNSVSPGGTPLTSAPSSRPMSRRSSSSCKAVRFARCTNASVYPALSGEEYDRSPIIPSCGADSLQLPQRDNKDDEGWIKCKERQKAADAKKAAGIDPAKACAPWAPHTTGVENPVEGVHGLIEGANGGFFVGDERDSSDLEDLEMSDVVVDDANEDDARPELIRDDASSSDDSDGSLSVSTSTTTSEASLSSPLTIPSSGSPATPIDESQIATPTVTRMPDLFACGPVSTPMSASNTVVQHPVPTLAAVPLPSSRRSSIDQTQDESRSSTPPTSASVTSSVDSEAGPQSVDDGATPCATKKDRYGICALGKYSRKDVFSTFDSLGGF